MKSRTPNAEELPTPRDREPLNYLPSVTETLGRVASEYPEVKLLTLGQTVLWDEPMKATIRRALDDLAYRINMVLGVHDTDYFSKLPHGGGSGYRILAHNDGSTRGLWTSAGEISQLFGSETVVTRDRYLEYGVAFDQIAHYYPGGREELLERQTEAWGWRGLVADSDTLITAELPLKRLGEQLKQLATWAFEGTIELIADPAQRQKAQEVSAQLLDLLDQHLANHKTWTLSDFYQHLFPHLYELLLGYQAEDVSITGTVELLTLNRATAALPRFRLLDLFLRAETRAICEEAYDASLAGSAMYELEKFGPGALPFELVIPGRGRGTLRLTDSYAVILTPRPIFVSLQQPIQSVGDLASWIEDQFGKRVAVIGKAVTLVSMLAHEFMFVFHEGGSGYVFRTRRMNDIMASRGVELSQYPLLRIHYDTWGALSAVPIWLRLPPHLASAYGQEEIHVPSFAQRWRAVVEEQRALLEEMKQIHRPRELIRALNQRCKGCWDVLADNYDRLHLKAQERDAQLRAFRSQIREQFERLRAARRDYAAAEAAKGENFRRTLWPLLERARAGEQGLQAQIDAEVERRKAEFDVKLALLRFEVKQAKSQISALRHERRKLVSSPEAMKDHEERRDIEREAELARMSLVRNAIQTVDGLDLANHRPTAWWLLMLSPDGAWFRRVCETAEMYLEPLRS